MANQDTCGPPHHWPRGLLKESILPRPCVSLHWPLCVCLSVRGHMRTRCIRVQGPCCTQSTCVINQQPPPTPPPPSHSHPRISLSTPSARLLGKQCSYTTCTVHLREHGPCGIMLCSAVIIWRRIPAKVSHFWAVCPCVCVCVCGGGVGGGGGGGLGICKWGKCEWSLLVRCETVGEPCTSLLCPRCWSAPEGI